MSRELKRVPLDFKGEIGQIWKGYLCPYSNQKCKGCDGSGYNKETKKISDDWYAFNNPRYIELPNGRRYNDNAWCNHITEIEIKALIENNRLWDFTRIPKNEEQKLIVEEKLKRGENSWLPFDNGYIPTPEEVNEWNKNGLGHDAINQSICVKARAKHLGVFGYCDYCNGEGVVWYSDEIKEMAEKWEPYEPPKGGGYQLWCTTTEGHPMSPVFPNLELLCEYLEQEKISWFGSFTADRDKWFEMLNNDNCAYQEGNNIFL